MGPAGAAVESSGVLVCIVVVVVGFVVGVLVVLDGIVGSVDDKCCCLVVFAFGTVSLSVLGAEGIYVVALKVVEVDVETTYSCIVVCFVDGVAVDANVVGGLSLVVSSSSDTTLVVCCNEPIDVVDGVVVANDGPFVVNLIETLLPFELSEDIFPRARTFLVSFLNFGLFGVFMLICDFITEVSN